MKFSSSLQAATSSFTSYVRSLTSAVGFSRYFSDFNLEMRNPNEIQWAEKIFHVSFRCLKRYLNFFHFIMKIILRCREYSQCAGEGKIYIPLSLFQICVFEIGSVLSQRRKQKPSSTKSLQVVVLLENNYCNLVLLFLITTQQMFVGKYFSIIVIFWPSIVHLERPQAERICRLRVFQVLSSDRSCRKRKIKFLTWNVWLIISGTSWFEPRLRDKICFMKNYFVDSLMTHLPCSSSYFLLSRAR